MSADKAITLFCGLILLSYLDHFVKLSIFNSQVVETGVINSFS